MNHALTTESPQKAKSARLRDEFDDWMRFKGKSENTRADYIADVLHFVLFNGKLDPRTLGRAEVKAYLTHLAVDHNVGWKTQNQNLCALVLFYDHFLNQPLGDIGEFVRACKPPKLPVDMQMRLWGGKKRDDSKSCEWNFRRLRKRQMCASYEAWRKKNSRISRLGLHEAEVFKSKNQKLSPMGWAGNKNTSRVDKRLSKVLGLRWSAPICKALSRQDRNQRQLPARKCSVGNFKSSRKQPADKSEFGASRPAINCKPVVARTRRATKCNSLETEKRLANCQSIEKPIKKIHSQIIQTLLGHSDLKTTQRYLLSGRSGIPKGVPSPI